MTPITTVEIIGAELPIDPETDALRRDVGSKIQGVMDDMTPAHRRIVERRYVDDLTYSETAGIEDIKLGTVMSRLSRAKEGLRKAAMESDENRQLARELMEP